MSRLILNVPEMRVTGRSVRAGQQYELTLQDLALPTQESNVPLHGVVNCNVAYCRAEDSANVAVPLCPNERNPLPHAPGSLFHTI